MSLLHRAAARAGISTQLIDRLSMAMLFLGFAALAAYAIGMAQDPIAHEAFHDLRHAAGFPCH